MTRRQLGTGLAITGILLAILAVHTMDAPETTDATNALMPQPIPKKVEPAADVPPKTAVASVTLPPPPALEAPRRTVEPLEAASPAAPKPTRRVKPIAAEHLVQKPVAPAKLVEPMAPAPKLKPAAKIDAVAESPKTEKARKALKTETLEPAVHVAEKTIRQAGRPLLRMLEHGDGPIVEITWPGDRRARGHLHRLFSQCYGMRVALIDDAGRLFDADSPRGTPWAINTDRFSGFIRQSSGGVPLAERQTVMRIRNLHGLDSRAAAVRVFPRRADALLLGGLSQLVGPGYRKARRIQATYRLAENQVRIEGIRVDGTAVNGAIDLTRAARRGCIL